jgi:hypothetical protein
MQLADNISHCSCSSGYIVLFEHCSVFFRAQANWVGHSFSQLLCLSLCLSNSTILQQTRIHFSVPMIFVEVRFGTKIFFESKPAHPVAPTRHPISANTARNGNLPFLSFSLFSLCLVDRVMVFFC